MKQQKVVGLVAHDANKKDMTDWVIKHYQTLQNHKLVCTGTTGRLIEDIFKDHNVNVDITKLHSGPLGGDQQMGALISQGKIDVLIFFIDPMTAQPHDVDVKALERLCAVYNIVIACTRSTADFVITSSLFNEEYNPHITDYTNYLKRNISWDD